MGPGRCGERGCTGEGGQLMFRLGLSLSFRGGRDAIPRLTVIVAAVAVGITLLLTVFALFNAYNKTINRPCWQCTGMYDSLLDSGPPPDGPVSTAAGPADLWSYTEDFYQGHIIERADVAALGAGAPVMPGIAGMPKAGQYYASPALARLIASVPANQLAQRFPGTQVGTISQAARSCP